MEPKTLPGFRDFLPENFKKADKIAVFIDAANLQKSVLKLGRKISYRFLKNSLKAIGELIYIGYFTVSPETEAQKDFIKSLQRFGYDTNVKPLKLIKTIEGKIVRKANFDVEIAVEAMDKNREYDTIILFSGDSDFNYLIKKLKFKGKKAVVISTRYRVAHELVRSADIYLDLKDLNDLEFWQQKSPAFSQGDKNNLSTAKKV